MDLSFCLALLEKGGQLLIGLAVGLLYLILTIRIELGNIFFPNPILVPFTP